MPGGMCSMHAMVPSCSCCKVTYDLLYCHIRSCMDDSSVTRARPEVVQDILRANSTTFPYLLLYVAKQRASSSA
jgi:hypothetical protein